MASVPLTFTPPDVPNLTNLHIEESASQSGPFVEIEVKAGIGTYPDYITEYTTANALNAEDWFRIRFSDAGGLFTPYSVPIKGGTTTLVGEVVKRVRDRDPYLDVRVVAQEAEAAIQSYFGADIDPYDPTLTVNYMILNGLAYLTMARSYISIIAASGDVSSATIGLVSFKSDSGSTNLADIERLIDLANQTLGLSFSTIMLLEDIEIGNSIQGITWRDQSRLVLETEIS
jgi:hypothetical protein